MKSTLHKFFGFLLLIFTTIISVNAQVDTEFWFAAPEITSGHAEGPVTLRIATFNQAANVVVEIPTTGQTIFSGTVAANSLESISLDTYLSVLENTVFGSPQDKGLHITSTENVSAYYEVLGTVTNTWDNGGSHPSGVRRVVNTDIFALKGNNALGTEFHVPFQNQFANVTTDFWNGAINGKSSIDIVATEDGTNITIVLPAGVSADGVTSPINVTLNRGQTYSVRATGTAGNQHLAGTKITSNKKIAVTVKDDSIGENNQVYDLVGDQIVPIDRFGREFIVYQGYVFITASTNNTQIKQDGAVVATINAGQTHYVDLTSTSTATYFETTEDVVLLHTARYDGEMGQAVVPSIKCNGSNEVVIARATGPSMTNYAVDPAISFCSDEFFLYILCPSGSEGNFTTFVNGVAKTIFSAAEFQTVPGRTDWKFLSKSMPEILVPAGGVVRVINNSAKYHLGTLSGKKRTSFGGTGSNAVVGPTVAFGNAPVDCSAFTAWSDGEIAGVKRTYNGFLWESQWWGSAAPGSDTNWKKVGKCQGASVASNTNQGLNFSVTTNNVNIKSVTVFGASAGGGSSVGPTYAASGLTYVDCSTASTWDNTQNYPSPGTVVRHNGNKYSSQWYASAGEEPGVNSVWLLLGTCGSYPTADNTKGLNFTVTGGNAVVKGLSVTVKTAGAATLVFERTDVVGTQTQAVNLTVGSPQNITLSPNITLVPGTYKVYFQGTTATIDYSPATGYPYVLNTGSATVTTTGVLDGENSKAYITNLDFVVPPATGNLILKNIGTSATTTIVSNISMASTQVLNFTPMSIPVGNYQLYIESTSNSSLQYLTVQNSGSDMFPYAKTDLSTGGLITVTSTMDGSNPLRSFISDITLDFVDPDVSCTANDNPPTGFRYGYFSDFNAIRVSIDIGDTCIDSGSLNLDLKDASGNYYGAYQWSSGGSDIAGETNSTFSINTSGTYGVTVSNGVGCDASDEFEVTLNKKPAFDIPPGTIACNITSVDLIPQNDNFSELVDPTFQWKKDGVDIADATNQTYTATSGGTYTLSVVNGCGSDEGDVVIEQVDIDVSIPNQSTCSTTPLDLDAGLYKDGTEFTTYKWELGGSVVSTNRIISGASVGGTYTITVTKTAGSETCSASATVEYTVDKVPAFDIPPGDIYCEITSIDLIPQNDNFAELTNPTFTWKKDGVVITDATNSTYTATSGGTYTLSVVNGCGSDEGDVVIGEYDLSVDVQPYNVCITTGNPVPIDGGQDKSGTDFDFYKWYAMPDIVNVISSNRILNTSTAGTYKLVVSNTAGCKDSGEFVLTARTVPEFEIDADTIACEITSIELIPYNTNFDQLDPATTYKWSLNGTDIPGANATNYTATSGGTYTLYVDQPGCGDKSGSVEVSQPVFGIDISIPDICVTGEDFVEIDAGVDTVSKQPFASYLWSNGATTQKALFKDPGEYTLTVTNDIGCQATASFKFTKNIIPWYTFGVGPLLCGNATTTITIDTSNLDLMEDERYEWYRINQDGSQELVGTDTMLVVENMSADSMSFELKVINGCGVARDTVVVKKQTFLPPNIFTPNGDGFNETWTIPNLEDIGVWEVIIVNKWGDKVYENQSYDNSWDGSGVEDDTYYYELRDRTLKCPTFKGWIQILR